MTDCSGKFSFSGAKPLCIFRILPCRRGNCKTKQGHKKCQAFTWQKFSEDPSTARHKCRFAQDDTQGTIPSGAQRPNDHRWVRNALAGRPAARIGWRPCRLREMTLDCRTLWSVRFFAAKGHFCSLLLSNILVTSAFCRLTISPIFFHSTFPVFSLLSLSAGCSYRLEFLSIDKPPCRFFWNLWSLLS